MARPRKYATPEAAREAKRTRDRERRRAERAEFLRLKLETIMREKIYACCLEWYLSSPHRGKVCLQHQDWRKATKQAADRYRSPERHAGHGSVDEGSGRAVAADNDASSPDQLVIADMAQTFNGRDNDPAFRGFRVAVDPDSYQAQAPNLRKKVHDGVVIKTGHDSKLEKSASKLMEDDDD